MTCLALQSCMGSVTFFHFSITNYPIVPAPIPVLPRFISPHPLTIPIISFPISIHLPVTLTASPMLWLQCVIWNNLVTNAHLWLVSASSNDKVQKKYNQTKTRVHHMKRKHGIQYVQWLLLNIETKFHIDYSVGDIHSPHYYCKQLSPCLQLHHICHPVVSVIARIWRVGRYQPRCRDWDAGVVDWVNNGEGQG